MAAPLHEIGVLLNNLEAARIELARRQAGALKASLYEFFVASWPVHEPGTLFRANWHLKAFCDEVQNVLEGWLVANGHGDDAMRARVRATWELNNLEWQPLALLVQNYLANLAPSTLKSRILMVVAPAWMWLWCASWSMLGISGVDLNVRRDSNAHRDLVESAWYRQTFDITWTIRRDKDAVEDWETTAGGGRLSKPMLGGYTGIHVDGIFLDDPDDAQRVFSEPARREVQDKWIRAIKNRTNSEDLTIRFAIQQRVHLDDWTSAQIANGVWSPDDRKAWAWLVIPVQFGRGPESAPKVTPYGWRDPRTEKDQNMHPLRFSEATIADEQRSRGPEGFEAQYNQNPQSLDGGMIPRQYLRFFRPEGEPPSTRKLPPGCGVDINGTPIPTRILKYVNGRPDLDWLEISVDCSNGSEATTASAMGILVIGGKKQERFCFDDLTEVMSIQGMYDAVRVAISRWAAQKVLIELKAAGSSVINDMRKAMAAGDLIGPDGRPAIIEIVPIALKGAAAKDSKEGRAAAMVSAWRAGLVYLLEGADWLYPKMARGGRVVDQGHIGEVTSYPRSKRNDRIDCWSQLMTWHRDRAPAYSHGGFGGDMPDVSVERAPEMPHNFALGDRDFDF